MRIQVRFKGDVGVVSLDGLFLAGGDGPFLRQKVKDLIDAGAKGLVVDFAGVPYIDSTGMGFLAGSRVSAENAGVKMILANVNPHVRKILDEVRLSQFFTIANNEEAALAAITEGTPKASSAELPAKKTRKPKKSPAPPAE